MSISGIWRLFLGSFLFATWGAAVFAGQPPGAAAPAPRVAVVTVTEEPDYEERRYPGQVEAVSTVNLTARISSDLTDVLFKEGSVVKEGDELFRFDAIRYEAAVKNIEAKLAGIKARLTYAENQRKRNQTLYERDVASKDDFENTQSNLDTISAEQMAAEAELVLAKDDLDHTKIFAPISGKIGRTQITAGNYVTPNSGVLATIVQTDPMRVRFTLANRDFLTLFVDESGLRSHAQVRLRLSNDTEYDHVGTIEFLDNQAHRSTDAIQVYSRFDNSEGKLLAGSTVTVLLARHNGRKVAIVPPSAIMYDGGGPYVYVLDAENKVSRRSVILASADPNRQRVSSGLASGERVISDGMHKARPGAIVDPEEN